MKNNTHPITHREWHQALSRLFSQRSPSHTCQVRGALSFWSGTGKNIDPGSASQCQEVAAGTETITNVEGVPLGGQGLLGGKVPCVLSDLPVASGADRGGKGFLQRRCTFPSRRAVISASSPLPHPEARSQAFLELLLVTWPSMAWSFYLNSCDPKISSYSASLGFGMTTQNITCWKIAIKNVGIYVHNDSTHFAGYITQRGIFFFHWIWSPGEFAQSHTLTSLYKRQIKIHQFDSVRTASCQWKTFTIQWSMKQLNISIQLTLTRAHAHTWELWQKARPDCLCDCPPKESAISVLRCPIQVLKNGEAVWFRVVFWS